MKIINKKAGFDFFLTNERVEAGISLKGYEAKSLTSGRGDISNSYAKIVDGELFLLNANFPVSDMSGYDSTRTRKLLLHKSEIQSLDIKAKQQKLQIVPVLLYNKGRKIKCELALGKPKHRFEKKESIKRKDLEREIEREFKGTK